MIGPWRGCETDEGIGLEVFFKTEASMLPIPSCVLETGPYYDMKIDTLTFRTLSVNRFKSETNKYVIRFKLSNDQLDDLLTKFNL